MEVEQVWTNSVYVNATLEHQKRLHYLLYASFEGVGCMSVLGHFIKVAVSSDEEVKCKSELGVCAFRHPLHCSLVVYLHVTISTGPRDPHHVPLIQWYWRPAPALNTSLKYCAIYISTAGGWEGKYLKEWKILFVLLKEEKSVMMTVYKDVPHVCRTSAKVKAVF